MLKGLAAFLAIILGPILYCFVFIFTFSGMIYWFGARGIIEEIFFFSVYVLIGGGILYLLCMFYAQE